MLFTTPRPMEEREYQQYIKQISCKKQMVFFSRSTGLSSINCIYDVFTEYSHIKIGFSSFLVLP